MIRFRCPKCQENLKAPPLWAGARTQCPGCGHPFRVPAPTDGAAWRDIVLVRQTAAGQRETAGGLVELKARMRSSAT